MDHLPGNPASPPVVTGIEIEGLDNKSNPGETIQLHAEALFVGGYYTNVNHAAQWTSSNQTILTSRAMASFRPWSRDTECAGY